MSGSSDFKIRTAARCWWLELSTTTEVLKSNSPEPPYHNQSWPLRSFGDTPIGHPETQQKSWPWLWKFRAAVTWMFQPNQDSEQILLFDLGGSDTRQVWGSEAKNNFYSTLELPTWTQSEVFQTRTKTFSCRRRTSVVLTQLQSKLPNQHLL